jgi:hypothetical protein
MTSGRKLSAFVLGAVMLVSGAGVLQAHADRCDDRIHKAEHNLADAVRKHGEHSRQAEKRRHELEDVRASCHR